MKYLFVISIFIFTACNMSNEVTKAKIIERKMMPGNRLLIRYVFKAGNTIITDSLEMKNKVIPNDSITVTYQHSDPAKNTLKL